MGPNRCPWLDAPIRAPWTPTGLAVTNRPKAHQSAGTRDPVTDLSRQFDVLVIGGGNAALCAAVTARKAGASVLILEHAPRAFRGGNSRHTRNLRAMHSGPTSVLTESYLEDEYWDDLLRVTGGNTDEQLARMTIRGTAEALPWMEAHGVRFQPSLSGTLSLSRTNAW
jgi:tricarballylate dehydrogenase